MFMVLEEIWLESTRKTAKKLRINNMEKNYMLAMNTRSVLVVEKAEDNCCQGSMLQLWKRKQGY